MSVMAISWWLLKLQVCSLKRGLLLMCLRYLERVWLKQFSCISSHSVLNWAESFISLMHNASSRLWWGDLFRPDAINCFLLLLFFFLSWQCAWAHPSSPLSGYARHGSAEMTCKIVCVCVEHKTIPCVNPQCGYRGVKTVNDEAEKSSHWCANQTDTPCFHI